MSQGTFQGGVSQLASRHCDGGLRDGTFLVVLLVSEAVVRGQSQGQLAIDFEYDERTVRLATEVAIMLTPYVAPGTPRDNVRLLAERIAKVAEKRYKDAWEPKEGIRCHTCDDMTTVPGNRVRVAVCNRCSVTGATPGSDG